MTDNKPLGNWCDVIDENDGKAVRKATKEKMKSNSDVNTRSKRAKHKSESDSDRSSVSSRKPLELETDPDILQRRQKQIDYGKNTVGYHNYTSQVPVHKRTKDHPKTPDKYAKYSRRSWDALIKIWRHKLHKYDTDKTNSCEEEQ